MRRLFSSPARRPKHTIFIVEDDVPIADVIRELLDDEGYNVHVANTAEEALKLLETVPMPDTFVVDYMLPDMNGRQFIESIRVRFGQRKLPPVLMLTASKEGESIANALQLTDFMPKPFDNTDLLDHVAKLVKRNENR